MPNCKFSWFWLIRRLLIGGLAGFVLLLSASRLGATSTEGAVSRNIQIDGVVSSGAAPGTNAAQWETNEVFQGFQGIINWYMTWDDDSLYLGKVGGNNNEPGVLYLRADYPGAQFADTAKDYNGLKPLVTPMGGVNFACFFRSNYDEFRTWNGTSWTNPAFGLSPAFSSQINGDHMEIAIPWDSITGGQGKPLNIRAIMYQYDPASSNCTAMNPNPFVYAESPWGTGLPGDGPNVGVTDGIPTSPPQPGGCGTGADPITRWWGCYPVIGGVSSNGWVAVPPDAGPDISICEDTFAVMAGNTPPATAQGTWSVISFPTGAGTPVFIDPNNPTATVDNLTDYGTYSFEWSINYRNCPATPDTLVLIRYESPPLAQAGPDSTLACLSTSIQLQGNDPGMQQNGSGGVGQWSQVFGNWTVQNPFDSLTTASGSGNGLQAFAWNISNGPCPGSRDTVEYFVPIPPTAQGGPDTSICEEPLLVVRGNNPADFGPNASGNWSQVSGGPSTLSFVNPADSATASSNYTAGVYQLIWTVSNEDCPPAADTFQVISLVEPFADAGDLTYFCEEDSGFILLGNDPVTSVQISAYGSWNQVSGPVSANLLNPNYYISGVEGLEPGTFVFEWIVSNPTCPSDTDDVTLIVSGITENGMNSITNSTTQTGNGIGVANAPLDGIPPYTYSLDNLNFQNSPSFSGLAPGTYTVYFRDSVGCQTSLVFEIELAEPPVGFVVPTGFSPNGDNTNDTWEIPGIDNYPQAEVAIFNVWGAQIFESSGSYQPWNGQYGGADLPEGTYYFVIRLNDPEDQVFKGNLSLFR